MWRRPALCQCLKEENQARHRQHSNYTHCCKGYASWIELEAMASPWCVASGSEGDSDGIGRAPEQAARLGRPSSSSASFLEGEPHSFQGSDYRVLSSRVYCCTKDVEERWRPIRVSKAPTGCGCVAEHAPHLLTHSVRSVALCYIQAVLAGQTVPRVLDLPIVWLWR